MTTADTLRAAAAFREARLDEIAATHPAPSSMQVVAALDAYRANGGGGLLGQTLAILTGDES